MSYNGFTRVFVETWFGGRLPEAAPRNEDGSVIKYRTPFRRVAENTLFCIVWVEDQNGDPAIRRRRYHRIRARCPECGFECSFGRLDQHYAVHANA